MKQHITGRMFKDKGICNTNKVNAELKNQLIILNFFPKDGSEPNLCFFSSKCSFVMNDMEQRCDEPECFVGSRFKRAKNT